VYDSMCVSVSLSLSLFVCVCLRARACEYTLEGGLVWDLLELQLQEIVNSQMWVLGDELLCSGRAVHTLIHWAMCLDSEKSFCCCCCLFVCFGLFFCFVFFY
jgi:hypothetical protein